MYHRALQVKKEEGILEEMLKLQREIRSRREIERGRDNSSRDKYTKIFQPITKSLTSLKSPIPQPSTTPIKKEEEEPLIRFNDDLVKIEGPGELYTRALATIPPDLRDDGMLGLNTKNHTIGDWNFNVIGNTLVVRKRDEEDSQRY